MKSILMMFTVLLAAYTSVNTKAGQVQQLNTSDILSIIEYKVVTSDINENILRRNISVLVHNKTMAPLHHVYLDLDSAPAHVTGGGALYYPEIGVGEARESTNMIELTIDLSQQQTSELELVWQIKVDIDGNQIIDEIAVSESIE